eukprot:scaffold36845_cov168-Amphora_coffeaeformis.AAC.4
MMLSLRLSPIAAIVWASLVGAFVPSATLRQRTVQPFGETSLLSSLQSSSNEAGGKTATQLRPNPPKIMGLKTLQDFLDFVDNAPPDSLSVIKFYGKSCPLCKRIEMKYKKMAHFYQKAPIRFAEVEKTVHPDLCSTLGVDRFPYIQIYRISQCVASHGTESDKTFGPIVNDTIQRELMMRPEDWDAFLTAFAEPIRRSTDKLETLRSML